jgi:hypothetical protein
LLIIGGALVLVVDVISYSPDERALNKAMFTDLRVARRIQHNVPSIEDSRER